MTVDLRDVSNHDDNTSLAGYAGATHKVTEGRTFVDAYYQGRVSAWRTPGRILGSYHVLHTTDPAGQLDCWIRQQDKLTPWWRDWPHWVMQIDAERWPTDNVPASVVLQFARMLVDAGVPGWKVTYASRGQYGDALRGIATPLWNAAYHGSSYPGDGAVDWAPYSGRTPTLWQYTDTPFDKSAFRGSLQDLLTLIGGTGAQQMEQTDMVNGVATRPNTLGRIFGDQASYRDWGYSTPPAAGTNPPPPGSHFGAMYQAAAKVLAASALGGTTAQVTLTQDQVDHAVTAALQDPATLDALAARISAHLGLAVIAAGHVLGG